MEISEWDAYASRYDEEPDHGLLDPLVKQRWKELLISRLPNTPIRIIDMGAGTGSITEILADAGHHVTYVDSSHEMTKLAKRKCERFRNQIDFFTCSMEDLDQSILDSKYDVVFGRHVLWVTDDLPATLKVWHSILTESGSFVLVEGFWSTGTGITSKTLAQAIKNEMGSSSVFPLEDAAYWGKEIDDERYLVVSG